MPEEVPSILDGGGLSLVIHRQLVAFRCCRCKGEFTMTVKDVFTICKNKIANGEGDSRIPCMFCGYHLAEFFSVNLD